MAINIHLIQIKLSLTQLCGQQTSFKMRLKVFYFDTEMLDLYQCKLYEGKSTKISNERRQP